MLGVDEGAVELRVLAQEWEQALGIQPGIRLQPGDLQNRGIDVLDDHGGCHFAGSPDPRGCRRFDDQGNSGRPFVRQGLGEMVMIAKELAVIGREDDPGLLLLEVAEGHEEAPDHVV